MAPLSKVSGGGPLTPTDKKILTVLLNPNGRITTYSLAKKTGLPRTTVQRRRSHLESRFLEFSYTLKLEELGFRRVELLISTQGGKTLAVANDLLKLDPIVMAGATVGQQTIDLRVEAIIKDNSELLDLLELVKGKDGVRDVMWSELVRVIGRKRSIPFSVLEKV